MARPAVIFDLDGTLIDSFTFGYKALCHAAAACGLTPPPHDLVRSRWGTFWPQLFASLFPGASSETATTLIEAWRAYEHVHPPTCPAIPGARGALQRIRAAGAITVLLTNRTRREGLEDRLMDAGIDQSLFKFIRFPMDAIPPKPHRRALDAVLDLLWCQFGIRNPASVCMVSDQQEDAIMAFACGCGFVGVLTGASTREDFERFDGRGVLCIADSIADVPAALGLTEDLSE